MSDPLLPDPDHPDDLALSGALDGIDDGAVTSHLASCPRCRQRSAALASAGDALRSPITPLAPSALDALIATALAAASPVDEQPAIAPVVALSSPSRGRLRMPPPSWLVGAAAAIAVLAGLAGLLRPTGGDDAALVKNLPAADSAGSGRSSDASGEAESAEAPTFGAPAGGGAAVDPETVGADLGDQDDPDALVAALGSAPRVGTTTAAAARTGPSANEAAEEEADASTAAPAPAAAPLDQDRAQCRADAERIGAGRFGALVSTSTLRWTGRPAEVLVFALTEPAGGVTRQALVLSRPGCALLADPRF